MADAADILVAGALHLDVVVDAPRLPALDETLPGSGVRYVMGGKGANQAVAAARMGARVAMAGAVGDDAFAATLLGTLEAAGVDHSGVRRLPGASGMSVAIVEQTGAYGAVIVSGVNRDLDPAAIQFPQGCRLLVLQNEIPEPVNVALAAKARTSGIAVLLNAAPARTLPPMLIGALDLLVVNRVEAAQLSGSEDPHIALAALRRLGPRAVIVTLGGDGLIGDDGEAFAAPAFPVAVRSTHGAGDAFVGALAAEYLRRGRWRDAAAFAQMAAALHVSREPEARATIDAEMVRAALAATG